MKTAQNARWSGAMFGLMLHIANGNCRVPKVWNRTASCLARLGLIRIDTATERGVSFLAHLTDEGKAFMSEHPAMFYARGFASPAVESERLRKALDAADAWRKQ